MDRETWIVFHNLPPGPAEKPDNDSHAMVRLKAGHYFVFFVIRTGAGRTP